MQAPKPFINSRDGFRVTVSAEFDHDDQEWVVKCRDRTGRVVKREYADKQCLLASMWSVSDDYIDQEVKRAAFCAGPYSTQQCVK